MINLDKFLYGKLSTNMPNSVKSDNADMVMNTEHYFCSGHIVCFKTSSLIYLHFQYPKNKNI